MKKKVECIASSIVQVSPKLLGLKRGISGRDGDKQSFKANVNNFMVIHYLSRDFSRECSSFCK